MEEKKYKRFGLTPTKARRLTARQNAFLQAYIDHAGNITRASKAAKMDRTAHYLALKNDPYYAECFLEAEKLAVDVLIDEARRRAFEGVDKKLYYQGKVILDENGNAALQTEYSDTLLMFLLKGLAAEQFGNKQEVTLAGKDGAPIRVEHEVLQTLSDEQLAKLAEVAAQIEVIDVTPEPKQIEGEVNE